MIDFIVQGLIFDLDDTLIDNKERTSNGFGLHERSRLMALRELGKTRGIAALANYPAETCSVAFRRARFQTIESTFWYMLTDAGAVSAEALESPDHELIVALTARKHELYDALIRKEVEALPGAVAFVKAFSRQGKKQAMATTALGRHVDSILAKIGLSHDFPPQRRITHELVSRPKPDPEAYDLAFKSLGLPEKDRMRTCAFDDDPRGIAAALAAGLFVCGITTRHSKRELRSLRPAPHLVASSYAEFAKLFGTNSATISNG